MTPGRRLRRRVLCQVLISLLVAATRAAGAAPPERPAPGRVLRVCADPNNLPFSNQQREGIDDALAALVARELGTELAYTWRPQRRGFVRNTLDAGLCDVMMSVPTSYERVRTTAPLYRSSYVFVTRAGAAPEIRSFDDPALRGLRIGVQVIGDDYANTPPAHALARRGLTERVVGFPVAGDYAEPDPPARILDALAAGRIDVAVVWGPLAGWYARRSPVPLRLVPVSPQVDLPFLPFVFDISMGVRRDDDALRAELDAVLARRRAEVDALLARFGVPRVDAAASAAAPADAPPPAQPSAPGRGRAPARELVWVSNEREGTVSAIDAASHRVVETIAVGGRPRGIQVSDGGRTVHVAVSRPRVNPDPALREGVVAIDALARRVRGLAAVGSDPECFAVGTRPARLYVANEDAGTASITDLDAGRVIATLLVGVEPEGVAISPDERWVYVTAETSNTVSVIDTRAGAVTGNFLVEARPRAAAFSADGRLALVTAEIGRAVSVVDATRHTVIATYRFPELLQRPVGVVFAPDGRRAYVATGRANSVAVLDLSEPRQPRLLRELAVGERPWGVALDASGRRLYSANGGSNDVSVIDTATYRVLATVPVGDGPWGLAVGPDPGAPVDAARAAPAARGGTR